ncbi:MAG TPA: tetratricopeptide repeat protein, partial [Rhizomicrobium sp.]|nr:tetratricopeptide repeat protein [Rhizomicrobium sp.]
MDPELIAEEARNAQRRREWAEAAALWDSYSKLKPKDVRGWTALGQIAVAAGDLDRARELAGALLEKFPGSDAGPLLLARVAATSGDTEGTLAQYRAALVLKPKNRQTMRALGRALITSEQFDEAETWARKLTEQWPGEPDGIVQLAQIAERQSNAAAALRRYRRAHNAFPSNAPVTREFVKHLIRAGEIDEARGVVDVFADIDPAEAVRIRGDHLRQFSPGVDALAFWAEAFGLHGDDPAIARELADVALRRGDVLLAEKGLRGVIGLGASRLNDCRFVIGIANLHAQAGDSAAVRSLVRGYLKALKPSPDYRIAALKLSPLIFVHFLRAETGKRRRRRNSVRTGRMLERAPVPSTTKSFLARGIVLERQLRSRGPALLETGVSRGQAERFVAVVQDRLARGKPFSFVRLGDGESNCLRYEPELRHHFAHDAQEREVVWWGSSLSDEVRERFARRVATAVWQSDAIGIPTVSRFLRDLRLDT